MNENNQTTPQPAETDQTTAEAPKNNKLKSALIAAAAVLTLAGTAEVVNVASQSGDAAAHAIDKKPAPAPVEQTIVPGTRLTELPKPVKVETTQSPAENTSHSDDHKSETKQLKTPSEPMDTPPALTPAGPEATPPTDGSTYDIGTPPTEGPTDTPTPTDGPSLPPIAQ